MNYNDIKKQYDNARKEQLAIDREIKKLNREIVALEKTESEIRREFETSLIREKSSSLKEYKKKAVSGLEMQLEHAENELKRLEQEYSIKSGEITFDNLLAQCSSKQDILQEVKSSSTVLQERLQEVLGTKFYDTLCVVLEQQNWDLESADLNKLIIYFNKSEVTVAKYSTSPSIIAAYMSDVERKLSGGDKDEKAVIFSSITAIIVAAISIFAGGYVFAAYVILMVTLALFHMIRNYGIYRILVVQKAVKENVDKIEELLRRQIEDEVKQQSDELRNQYQAAIKKEKEAVVIFRERIEEASTEADSSFIFDATVLRGKMQVALDTNEKRRSELLVRRNQLEDDLKEKSKRVQGIADDLKVLLHGLQEKYLSGVGKEVIFEPHFLFDIDTDKNRPDFFVHPQSSCLFLYDEISTVNDFIRLLCVQLRAKLNPFNLTVTLIDTINIGQEFIYFTARDDEGDKSVFRIATTEEEVKECIEDEAYNLMRRHQNIRRDFHDIKAYNEKMVEIKSLTEPYEFLFMIEPDNRTLDNSNMQRVITNGGLLGIFAHIFIEKQIFSENEKEAIKILDLIDRVYLLEGGKYFERAKDYVLENVVQHEEKNL